MGRSNKEQPRFLISPSVLMFARFLLPILCLFAQSLSSSICFLSTSASGVRVAAEMATLFKAAVTAED